MQLEHTFTPSLISLVGVKIAGHTAPCTLFAMSMSGANKQPGRFLGTYLGGSGQRGQWRQQKRPWSLPSPGAGRCWPAGAAAAWGATQTSPGSSPSAVSCWGLHKEHKISETEN